MSSISHFDYSTLPIFDISVYEVTSKFSKTQGCPEEAGDKFAAAYDALSDYNTFAQRLHNPKTYKTETGEEPTQENFYLDFQCAICALRQKNAEDIQDCLNTLTAQKIREFAQVHLETIHKVTKLMLKPMSERFTEAKKI